MKKLAIILSVILTAALTSCGDKNSIYHSPICGSWALTTINGVGVAPYDEDVLTFHYDGQGVFGRFNTNMVWSEYPITWDLDYRPQFNDYLYIYPWNGDTWTYRYRLTGSTLELFDLTTGDRLLYRRVQ